VERRHEQGAKNKEHGRGNEQSPSHGRRNGPRKGDDIAARVLDGVEAVRRLLPALQRDAASKHVAKQLWRAATGGGANYEEARSAESTADFVHKLRVATKELREAHYWLSVVQRSDWVRPGSLVRLIDEFDQLTAILVASARTAKAGQP
jgi:four helix bundle protein